ncbi:hypothetical protein [Superficieibacter sp. 1612_C1]|nr:hypothetical protein [Superficieibacter sp. 1612_C1]
MSQGIVAARFGYPRLHGEFLTKLHHASTLRLSRHRNGNAKVVEDRVIT